MTTTKHPSTAIVFDFGGVLFDWNPRYLFRKFFHGDLQATESFLQEIGFSEWNLKQDMGRPFALAVADHIQRFPQYAEQIQAYDERWEETMGGSIQPSVEILAELKQAGYTLYALSNWSEEKYYCIRDNYGFLDWFDEILISGEVRLAKPDPQIFEAFLARVGCKAEQCLLIDDTRQNIETAQRMGFDVILFQSPQQLRKELEERELL